MLKVPYYEKHVISGVYMYYLVLPEPATQNEEKERVLHRLCSPPTGKMVLLQAVRIRSFCYVTKGVIYIGRSPLRSDRRYLRGGAFIPELKFGVSRGKIAVLRNVVAQS